MTKRHNIIGVLLTLMLLIGCSMTTLAADWVKIGNTTYNMTNTATRIDADIALLDYKAQGLTSTVTASIGGTSYSGYSNVYWALYNYLVANATHTIPGSGGHGTNGQYIWPEDSSGDAIWYIPQGETATFQGDNAGTVGSRLVVVGGGTIRRVMDKRRFALGNSARVLCLQGQLTISGDGAPAAEIAMISMSAGTVYIGNSVKIVDSHGQLASGSGGGGAITQSGGTIYMMDDTQILNCNCKTTVTDPESQYYMSHGGAIVLKNSGTFKMMGNAKISSCTSGYAVSGNSIPYPSLGGAVYMEGGTFTMNDNATIQNCTAMVGGAIYVKSGTFTMNGGLIGGKNMTVQWDDNTTTTYPNVNTTNYTYITDIVLNTSTVTRNEARNAGAIYAQGGTVKLKGGVIAGNSTISGTAQTGTLSGTDNQIHGTTISTYYGSCILTQGTANLECNDGVTIYGNKSDGPAVCLCAGKTSTPNVNNFYGGEVKCNYCLTKYGAGVTVSNNVVANLRNNTKVTYNTTPYNGGGMLALEEGVINIYDNVDVSHNTAAGGGTASNRGNGGGFRVVGTLNVYGGTISYNYARGWLEYADPEDYTGVGGAISASSDMHGPGGSPRLAVVNLEGGKIRYNKATNHGGAVYLASSVDYESATYPGISATFNLDGTEISNNSAAHDGGGCYLTAWNNGRIEVELNEGDLKNNTAGQDGGGICVAVMDDVPNPENPGTNLISAGHSADVTIGDNVSGHVINIESNTASDKGGGVALKKGDVTMKSGNVKSNKTTTSHGGGIYVTGGNCLVLGGTISYNKTTASNTDGGGIYINTGGICTINGGSISYNKAVHRGGGFFVNPGASAVTNVNNDSNATTISYNSASYGGGAYIRSGTLNLTSATISADTATQYGGGIYMYSGTVNVNGTIEKCLGVERGGGVYMYYSATDGISGTFNMNGGTIGASSLANGNKSKIGGGLYMAGGTFNMKGGSIKYNEATSTSGGGAYIAGTATITGGNITYNKATTTGGGIYVYPPEGVTTTINSNNANTNVSNNSAQNGGGAFVGRGTLSVASTSGRTTKIENNKATSNGGGLYVNAGSVTASSATIDSNTATDGKGGGIFAKNAVTVTGGTVSSNKAENSLGGGIYAEAGSNTITVQTSAAVNSNKATKGAGIYAKSGSVAITSSTLGSNVASADGGGVYAEGGSVTMTTATLSSNSATSGNGGGIYGGGGDITVNAGSIASNTANSGNGGGVYATGGTITFDLSGSTAPTFTGNSAMNGGVLYMEGGTCDINAGTLGGSHANRNKATTSGGAIYVHKGTVNFATGTISYNTAGTSGGGLFVADNGTDYGTLNMTGNVTLSKNHVPAGKHGGGVYLAGVISIGSSTQRTILAQDNFAYGTVDTDPSSVTIDATNRNNVYLPTPVVNANHKDVITVVKNGLTTSTRVGFSVPHNFVPVIYCNESSPYTYLRSFLENPDSKAGSMWGTVFDDAEKYTTVHYPNNSFYDPQHIYLSGGTWVDHVSSYTIANPPAGFSVSGDDVTISSNEALAWLIKYINGISPYTSANAGVNVTLAANVDMGDYAWVPIASTGATQYSGDVVFTGTFNGNGHIISNLNCQYLGIQTGTNLGLFGTLGTNAKVENVQLKDAAVNTADMSSGTAWLGGIAGQTTGGVVESCVVDADIETLNADAVLGGVVGNNGAMVHSCFATADMTGYQMGGLVGANSGDLYNSYAYAKFTPQSGSTKYMGGLVGVNTGRVENCYARIQNTSVPGNTYFGYLVGDNTSGTLNYSYAPANTYTASGKTGTQTGLSTFGVTVANAYEYRVRDNQVASTNTYAPTYDSHHLADYQLKKYLNNWVNQDATHKATYAGWTRPTTQAINGDYPLLKVHGFNAVAATSGEITLDYGDINTLLTDYATADNSILFYGSKEGMDSNSGSAAPLYIDEDAVLTPSTAGDIVAHVGVTIDNSACHAGANPSFGGSDVIDWHFFSSALKNSQIGLHYGAAGSETEDTEQYGQGVYPSWTATFTNANGYFPINLNNYYAEWDLYAYCEPDYHWINLKRNSASHWHEDWPGINIPYTNDTEFGFGKGYMVALKEEGYLHAYGTLNTNTSSVSVPVTCTSNIGWTTREGHNLLGNPYQSYLDFEEFASKNASLWNDRRPFYIIMDEDNKDYVLYTVGQSPNPKQASRFLHPHQGFMIDSDITGAAKFDNSMRATTTTVTTSGSTVTWDSGFRGSEDAPCYPLVNLMATDANGNRDIVTVELGRPDKGGALKQDAMHSGKGSLWCRYEDEDYALVFTQPGLDAANIRFSCDEDAEFTMTWSTHNGEFSYLHLIDNMTGADIDCLSTSEYKFSARESDYNSRFRLVFDYTGVEENEDGPSTGSGAETFAYYSNGEIHLTDATDDASLQIIDMLGRVVVSRDGVHTVSTNGMTPGVYILRLTTTNGTRTQKIILN